ncbi:MAG: hypothetical protein Fur002_20490 [Anaerolineales bacterium]
MKPLFLNLIVAALLLTACAPQTNPPAASPAPAESQPQALATASQPQVTEAPAPAAVATSRGDKLEATDPASVQLASGGIQLVEFFRFT